MLHVQFVSIRYLSFAFSTKKIIFLFYVVGTSQDGQMSQINKLLPPNVVDFGQEKTLDYKSKTTCSSGSGLDDECFSGGANGDSTDKQQNI